MPTGSMLFSSTIPWEFHQTLKLRDAAGRPIPEVGWL
jgi:hypothetical protein